MNSNARRIILSVVPILVAVGIVTVVKQGQSQPKATYSQFLQNVQAGEVVNATIAVAGRSGADRITYTLKNGSRMKTLVPSHDREAMAAMRDKLVNIEIRDSSSQPYRLVVNAIPFFVLLGFWFFMMHKMKSRRS